MMDGSFPAPLFQLSDVSYNAAGTGIRLLNSVSLSIKHGHVTGIIGQNGSGKSTLMKILARQQTFGTGRILFRGQDLQNWKPRDLARRLAYLPQQTVGASEILVKELVALGRYPWHGPFGRFTKGDQQIVSSAIDTTGLRPLADRLTASLSGGEQQRAWLAMLLAQQPECLLLDEPTSALDIKYQSELLSLIRRMSRDVGMGTVVILHDVNMAARFCDEIIAMRSGQVVDQGSPEHVITTSILRELYQVEMDVHIQSATKRPFAVLR